MQPNDKPMNFSDVLHDELDAIEREKKVPPTSREIDAQTRAWQANLQGLAFSGGGIRSATFCLGVLQKLAEQRLLDSFDYLSTVSGGGYIGSWFSSLVHRKPWLKQEKDPQPDTHSTGARIKQLFKNQADRPQAAAFDPASGVLQLERNWHTSHERGNEPVVVAWLRRYSNYLSPKMGFSGDFVATIAYWMRNTVLNQVLLFLFFFLALLLPQWTFLLLTQPVYPMSAVITQNLTLIGLFCMTSAIFISALDLPKTLPDIRIKIPLYVVSVAVISCYALSLGLYHYTSQILSFLPHFAQWNVLGLPKKLVPMADWTLYIAMLYTVPWWIATLFNRMIKRVFQHTPCEQRHATWHAGLAVWLSPMISGVVGGALVYTLASYIGNLPATGRDWWAAGFGTPLMLVIFCMTLVLHQGLMARMFRISQFEWWARLGGVVLVVAAGWASVHVLLVYAPPLFDVLKTEYVTVGGITWLVPTVTGLLFANGSSTGAKGNKGWKELFVIAAPYLLVLGMISMMSVATHRLVFQRHAEVVEATQYTPTLLRHGHSRVMRPKQASVPTFQERLNQTIKAKNQASIIELFYMLLAAGLGFLVLAWRLDVNLFSIHYFYRNRLARCYLGASRYASHERDAHPFTGFDPCDDIKLHTMVQRPLHLLNTTINLSQQNELAWQDRKAASFTFSPIACGYSYQYGKEEECQKRERGGYCYSHTYMGGVKLGTAMAASGAAASPNMGYHTSPVTAFMLTVFNVRLGHWCPNPKSINERVLRRDSPSMGAWYLFKELFVMSNDTDNFVYLSDGGHFENLGVYELVRRRCRLIMVVDAAEDDKRIFEDFASLSRKCYTDFGVRIDIDLDALRLDPKTGYSECCWALGDVHYPKHNPANADELIGLLLYIKPSLMGHIPEDILNYASKNACFPHQSTTDQFFDEAQFESYRKLGYFLMGEVLAGIDKTSSPRSHKWTGFVS
ncbi:MAG: patatin-like phospholipase family protein [Gallionella sp.]|nr:patatin-like phospholipase family protein [Gallionella sp.]MDD4958903.1 patatin-like phospholipase family protein [Gallionella sp.]